MKTKNLLAAICIAVFTMATSMAQIGSNFGNPCLNTRKGPNTLKTSKHVVHGSQNRFNSHHRTTGNGNLNAVIINNQHNIKKPVHHIKKNRLQPLGKKDKIHQRKNHKHKDRGDK